MPPWAPLPDFIKLILNRDTRLQNHIAVKIVLLVVPVCLKKDMASPAGLF